MVETIESFLIQDYENYKILIVDNASIDDSVKYIKDNYQDIEIIENDNNSGWAEGNNIGIKFALEKGAEFVLLANNDLFIDDIKLLNNLIDTYQNLKDSIKIGFIGTNEYDFYIKDNIRSCGYNMYPKYEKFGLKFNSYRKTGNFLPGNIKTVDFAGGFFVLVNSEVFKNVAYFDDKFFMYAEETDLSLRAWSFGYYSIINTVLKIYHKGAKSSGKNSPFKIYYQIRNNFYLIRKNHSIIKYYHSFLIVYLFELFKFSIIVVLGKLDTGFSKTEIIKKAFLGFYHGFRNKMYRVDLN